MIKEIEYPSSGGPVAGVSWGAVFSGTFVAIAVMAALSLLGAGVGLASAPAADTAGGLAKGLKWAGRSLHLSDAGTALTGLNRAS